ncbi:tetratricopeptide repeat protein [Pseudorhodoplanes sp.]|uniref:tetratricopeptide repeat protein n=1 Tax=Pseudorhodoplanes sp. TaxID=1934341 RepID=UPI0039C9A8A8
MQMNSIAQLGVLTCALWLAPAFAFDGTRSPANTKPEVTPVEAFRSGAASLKAGQNDKALLSLQYAADQGYALAQWKLGRMYAEGDGVERNALRAFQYFSRIADTHAEESVHRPQARFVANAFVQLGHYYLDGIPNTEVKADPDRAREMYAYAASYFGDADAQYALARLYLDGTGGVKDPRQALRWLNLAANKGQPRAQALLGHLIFKGDVVPRQAARGLMWLTLAREGAAGEKWVVDMYEAAFRQATDGERQMAVAYLERYMKGRRD